MRSGGAERVVSQLLKHLQNDLEIHLALFSKEIQYDIPSDIKIIDLGQSEADNHLMMLLKLPYLSYKLSRYCKKNGIKYSVAFLNRPCYVNALMRNWWGFKGRTVVCERIHQSAELETYGYFKRIATKLLVRYAYRSADLVLANAKLIKADLEENFTAGKQVDVIYNPIDTAELNLKMYEAGSLNFDPSIFYFISVGNFRKEKNYGLLLEAFAGIKDSLCKLILVGSGPMEAGMRQKVTALGIESSVIFCGRDNNPFKYHRQSQCFVMSSDVEGFPNVLLEALACGKPAIATDCKSGPRELLAPGTDIFSQLSDHFSIEAYGILTPVGNAAVLTQAMIKMKNDVLLRETLQQKVTIRAAEFDIQIIRLEFLKAFLG
ncbi:N-acetylgalactosamine-N,N'-diacetylbacillosaminyl-diphospho-undecaprenol 4-alpha-N-acetylgalactosaminyltransferase [soil metagenome]